MQDELRVLMQFFEVSILFRSENQWTYQGIKTHLTLIHGMKTHEFSINNVLQKISQKISFCVSDTVSSFFVMKITYKVRKVTEHRLYLTYSCYECYMQQM